MIRKVGTFNLYSITGNSKPHMKSKPVMKDMLKKLDSVVDWQLLMISMGVEKFENDKIERNFQGDIDRQKQEAFDKWLRMKPDACWKDVIDALYEMKEITLANSLARKYDWKDLRVIHIIILSKAILGTIYFVTYQCGL